MQIVFISMVTKIWAPGTIPWQFPRPVAPPPPTAPQAGPFLELVDVTVAMTMGKPWENDGKMMV